MDETPEARRVDAYQDTIRRIEPDVAPIDAAAYYASAAIGLKRIADALEAQTDHLTAIVAKLNTALTRGEPITDPGMSAADLQGRNAGLDRAEAYIGGEAMRTAILSRLADDAAWLDPPDGGAPTQQEQKANVLAAIRAVPPVGDEGIDTSDIPEATEANFASAKLRLPEGMSKETARHIAEDMIEQDRRAAQE